MVSHLFLMSPCDHYFTMQHQHCIRAAHDSSQGKEFRKHLNQVMTKSKSAEDKFQHLQITISAHLSTCQGITAVMWRRGSALLQTAGLILLHPTGQDTASIQTPAGIKVGRPIPLNSQWKALCFTVDMTFEMKWITSSNVAFVYLVSISSNAKKSFDWKLRFFFSSFCFRTQEFSLNAVYIQYVWMLLKSSFKNSSFNAEYL